jgi:hypothetical protein
MGFTGAMDVIMAPGMSPPRHPVAIQYQQIVWYENTRDPTHMP